MRTRFHAAALAIAVAALAHPVSAQEDPLRERFADRLNEQSETSDDSRSFAPVWAVMDSAVLRELSGGKQPDAVNAVLATFPGFSGASEGDAVQIGRGSFYSEIPRELPSYVVLPIRAGRQALMMGVYNFGINEAGHISLFARRGDRWTRTGGMDARFAITPYLLPLADSALAVVTLDLFTGGDHQDGTVRVWRVRDGTLLPLRTLAREMKEPTAESRNGTVRVSFTRFPTHLAAPILGTRIEHVTTIARSGATVTVRDEVSNPWVEIVDRYYRLAQTSPAQARALLAAPALRTRLGTRVPTSHEDGGDLRAGTGWIVIGRGINTYRVTSRRGVGGQWRITAVEPAPAPR